MSTTRPLASPRTSTPLPSMRIPGPRGLVRSGGSALALVAGLALAACQDPMAARPVERETVSIQASRDVATSPTLKLVRRETARFHSTEQARAAGYVPTEHCVASPAGGMGMHWANRDLIDPVFDPARPEVMLYEPSPNGLPRLVAVEYIVMNVGQPQPELDGRPFDVGGTPTQGPHWSLHVWLYRENPDGMFRPFNPSVACH